MRCRHCASDLSLSLIDLGSAPPSNAYLKEADLKGPERWFPLNVLICTDCRLVQTEDFASFDELFDENYAYFSSFSGTWLKHSQLYAERMIERFGIGVTSKVVEVAANDGYLLQYFKTAGVPCLGVEPTASTAQAARKKGIDIVEKFFGLQTAEMLVRDGHSADLMAANNVLAHVPDINDFVSGFRTLLKPHGVATFEFPWLLNLIEQNQFDTIYHEHFSYLSLVALQGVMQKAGLAIFDVERIPTHGGSLRVFVQRADSGTHDVMAGLPAALDLERAAGLDHDQAYAGFQAKADRVKDDFVEFLIRAKREGKSVVGYGAAAKGNTLLNYAGVRPDLLAYVVDRNPEKQDKYLPGSRIPIRAEKALMETRPDFIVILPWNLRDEITGQLAYARDWGARFVTAVPHLAVE